MGILSFFKTTKSDTPEHQLSINRDLIDTCKAQSQSIGHLMSVIYALQSRVNSIENYFERLILVDDQQAMRIGELQEAVVEINKLLTKE